MVKNLKQEQTILADQTDAKRADLLHVQLYADRLHACPILPRVWKNFQFYIIIEESWNANLFQLLLALFHFIFTFTTEEQ